jgi:hypothetical protein
LLLVAAITISAQQTGFPKLTGPYFGQKPPRTEPELFAPDILIKSKQAHSNIVFSADGIEAYWCDHFLLFSKLENAYWTAPEPVPFSIDGSDDSPFISPDGRQLFFTSKRPTNPSDTTKKENVWVVDMYENGWSEPRLLPPMVNYFFFHWQISVDPKGDLYFQYESPANKANKRDIYFSEYRDGEYQKPEPLSEMINTEHSEVQPYISPEGDYIIFARVNNQRLADGRQDISLFISFRKKDNTWTRAVNIKEYVKYKYITGCPIVTQDGKYLFFLDLYQGQYQRYWISAKFINELRPKE